MAIVKLTGGLAMAAHHLGYGKRIADKITVLPGGRRVGSMQYEIDNTTQEFALVVEQSREWKAKGNMSTKRNAESMRQEIRELREIVEKLTAAQMNGKVDHAKVEAIQPGPPQPPPPPIPVELSMAPVGSIWKTKDWYQERGPRWLEVDRLHRENGKWIVDATVIGGHHRNKTIELASLLSHWDRQN